MQSIPKQPSGQRGGAMVEFAFVFPILFLLIYGTIVYSYVFVVNESIHYAAKEAAESAVRVDPTLSAADYSSVMASNARAVVMSSLGWLPESQRSRIGGEGGAAEVTVNDNFVVDGQRTVRVVVSFDVSESTPLFPVVRLFFVGEVPPLPTRMVASAIALI